MLRLKDQTNNSEQIWINKHKNGIIMLSRKMQEDGDRFSLKFY